MSSRDRILDGIRRGRQRHASEADAGIGSRIEDHPRGPQPARGLRPPDALIDLFEEKAGSAAATLHRVAAQADVPAAVAAFLAQENLAPDLVIAPDSRLDDIPWHERPMLSVRRGRTEGDDPVSVTGAFAGVAETGTLMLLSGPESPTTLNLLPETHIVVLRGGDVVGLMEDAWDRVRHAHRGEMPRTVNFITGPSRSADIGQQLQMGAHGPRRLHIVLVDGED